jgi:hypothetical protein
LQGKIELGVILADDQPNPVKDPAAGIGSVGKPKQIAVAALPHHRSMQCLAPVQADDAVAFLGGEGLPHRVAVVELWPVHAGI